MTGSAVGGFILFRPGTLSPTSQRPLARSGRKLSGSCHNNQVAYDHQRMGCFSLPPLKNSGPLTGKPESRANANLLEKPNRRSPVSTSRPASEHPSSLRCAQFTARCRRASFVEHARHEDRNYATAAITVARQHLVRLFAMNGALSS